MASFIFAVQLKGQNGLTSTQRFQTRDFVGGTTGAALDAAIPEILSFLTDYRAASNAVLAKTTITVTVDEDNSAPNNFAMLDQCALLNLNLDPAGNKTGRFTLFSPKSAVIVPNSTQVDSGQGDIQNLVAKVAATLLISDGEAVDTTLNGGIRNGIWKSKSK